MRVTITPAYFIIEWQMCRYHENPDEQQDLNFCQSVAGLRPATAEQCGSDGLDVSNGLDGDFSTEHTEPTKPTEPIEPIEPTTLGIISGKTPIFVRRG